MIGTTVINPTTDVVQFAFTAFNVSPTAWSTGSWDPGGPPYSARILVGPANGGVVLVPGSYEVWIKITDNPEVPVIQVGNLDIE